MISATHTDSFRVTVAKEISSHELTLWLFSSLFVKELGQTILETTHYLLIQFYQHQCQSTLINRQKKAPSIQNVFWLCARLVWLSELLHNANSIKTSIDNLTRLFPAH